MDGWELAREISKMDHNDIIEVFSLGFHCSTPLHEVLNRFSYSNAKERYDKWVDNYGYIKVGDEVREKGGGVRLFIVTAVYANEGRFSGVNSIGDVISYEPINAWEKTGRHTYRFKELLEEFSMT